MRKCSFRLQGLLHDKDKVQLSGCSSQGLQELRFALKDEAFLQENLRGVTAESSGSSSRSSTSGSAATRPHSLRSAAGRSVANLGSQMLTWTLWSRSWSSSAAPATVWMNTRSPDAEPAADVQGCLKGEHVGVGIKVAWVRANSSSPPSSRTALQREGLKPGDRITRIDGQQSGA